MSGAADKIKGLANETVGNVKQGIGSATGHAKLQARGEAQKATGDAEDGIEIAADMVKSRLQTSPWDGIGQTAPRGEAVSWNNPPGPISTCSLGDATERRCRIVKLLACMSE